MKTRREVEPVPSASTGTPGPKLGGLPSEGFRGLCPHLSWGLRDSTPPLDSLLEAWVRPPGGPSAECNLKGPQSRPPTSTPGGLRFPLLQRQQR